MILEKSKLPIVSIIGRPNVGKSSLFNRMLGKRIAVVDGRPGVTRDRNYHICEWSGMEFMLVDTGGMIPNAGNVMQDLIMQQAEIAIHESSLIVFVVDSMVGVTDLDMSVAGLLKRSYKVKTIVVANKTESEYARANTGEYYSLGLGEPFSVSAIHGQAVADLLDIITEEIKEPKQISKSHEKEIKIAIVGRPNAGKSSLVNCICKDTRVLVDDVPGTTRDAVDVHLESGGRHFTLIDTAGMRKKSKVKDAVEYYSNLRATTSIERCDVCIVMIDAIRGVEEQDSRIMRMAADYGKGLIVALNKWDLLEKDHKTFDKMVAKIDATLADLAHVPKISISALKGKRVAKLLELAGTVYEELGSRLDAAELKKYMQAVLTHHTPPAKAKRPIRIYSVKQEDVFPPTFVGHCNYPKGIKDSYTRFIRNRILDRYSFKGCPIRIRWRGVEKGEQ